jgi:excinuclease ABC subunit A
MSDWMIDFGPEDGDAGGEIIAQGTPETVAKIARSQTGACLNAILNA